MKKLSFLCLFIIFLSCQKDEPISIELRSIILYPMQGLSGFSPETIEFDVNEDGIADLIFWSNNFSGTNFSYEYVDVRSHGNTRIAASINPNGQYDPFCLIDLSIPDSVSWTDANCALYDHGGGNFNYSTSGAWLNQTNKYLLVRYYSGSTPLYAWIKMSNHSGSSIRIEEYHYQYIKD